MTIKIDRKIVKYQVQKPEDKAAAKAAGAPKAAAPPPAEEIVRDKNGRPTGVLKDNAMNLVSKVNVVFSGDNPITVNAEHGAITKDPRVVILEQAHLQGKTQKAEAQKTTLFLDSNNALERVLATRGTGTGASDIVPV